MQADAAAGSALKTPTTNGEETGRPRALRTNDVAGGTRYVTLGRCGRV